MSPLTNDQLQALQAQDEKCSSLTAMLRCGKLDPLVYSMNDGVLHRRVIEGGQTFQAIYIPRMPPGLIESILTAAHDDSGHNGFPRNLLSNQTIILLERYQRRRTATLHQLLHLSTAQDCCSKI